MHRISSEIINNYVEPSENLESTVSENDILFSQKIDYISNLPVELIHKIAFNLDIDSYDSLRKSSDKITQILPSYLDMLKGLHNGVSGELKENYQKLTFFTDPTEGLWVG